MTTHTHTHTYTYTYSHVFVRTFVHTHTHTHTYTYTHTHTYTYTHTHTHTYTHTHTLTHVHTYTHAQKREISASSVPSGYRLTMEGVNAHVREFEYAVRGALVIRAAQLDRVLKTGGPDASALPFDQIIYCNIGNPQAVGQASLTFPKQV
jgi:hypothetical protein